MNSNAAWPAMPWVLVATGTILIGSLLKYVLICAMIIGGFWVLRVVLSWFRRD